MSDFEIEKTLVLSTGHVTSKVAKWLESGQLFSNSYDYGWVIPANFSGKDLADEECSEADLACVEAATKLAKELGCQWVKFDQDGEQTDRLEYYEW